MKFNLTQAIEILERTPITIRNLLDGLSDDWILNSEGPKTWSPYDIVGHLIHGEKTDWIIRTRLILSESDNKTFEPFDRFAQFENSKGKSLAQLLDEFTSLRNENLSELLKLNISEDDLKKKASHPALGAVTLEQLLASWVVHDLNHIYQISRVMAKQYTNNVGPWKAYLKALNQ